MDKMENNPLCLQIPWEKNQVAFEKWKEVIPRLV